MTTRTKAYKFLPWVVLTAAVACGLAVFHVFDPAQHTFFPPCLFHKLTGWDCAGCGGQRALHQLLHGHLLVAFRLNPLVFVLLPLLLYWLVLKLRANLTGKPEHQQTLPPVWAWIVLVLILSFAVLRNLPFEPFAWFKP